MEIESKKKTDPETEKRDKERKNFKTYGIVALVVTLLIIIIVVVIMYFNKVEPATPLKELPEGTKLRILHFGDCYNIQEEDDKGGAARFITALEHYGEDANGTDHVTVFAGDMFGPSLISTV